MRENKKNQDISNVVSNLGFAFEMCKVIAHAVMAKGGTMQHLRRVVKEPELQQQIADLIVPAFTEATAGTLVCSGIERLHADREYRIQVGYTALPSFAELEKEFGEGNVSFLFHEEHEWHSHPSCAKIDRTPGERIMLVKHFDREITSEEAIAEMDRQGYRPATHREAYAFVKDNPEQQRQIEIVALGSFAFDRGRRYVAILDGDSRRRDFFHDWFGRMWESDNRFLFVRKDQKQIQLLESKETSFAVHVTYAALPSFAELEKEFGHGNAPYLDGYAFEKHASCLDIDETPGEKTFFMKHFNRAIKSEEAVAEMDKQGYRPATHLEAYAFARSNPDLQRKFRIVALGSSVVYDGLRLVAMFCGGADCRIFFTDNFDREWYPSHRFLFIRK